MIIKCPECGKKFSDMADACPKCGCPTAKIVKTDVEVIPDTLPKSPSRSTVKKTKPKKAHGCATKFVVVLILFLILFCLWVSSLDDDTTDSESTTAISEKTTQAKKKKASKKSKFVSKLTSVENVEKSAAKDAYKILTEDLGYKTVKVSETNESNTTFGIEADDDFLRLVVNDKVYRIWSGDFTLYEDGEVVMTKKEMHNRVVGDNDTSYFVIAEEIVSSYLKAPSTADFCSVDEASMQRNKKYVAVKGYVDSQNSFGAVIRSEFTVEFKVNDLKSFDYETIYINIDGESSGEYKELD